MKVLLASEDLQRNTGPTGCMCPIAASPNLHPTHSRHRGWQWALGRSSKQVPERWSQEEGEVWEPEPFMSWESKFLAPVLPRDSKYKTQIPKCNS